ncbi:PLP-dependent aminotransferase family protein [Tenacibaculum piscium]|uniref:cystathionine beta-synthase n=1 Tax=Tenacibaculum piscium TaxID=1458515 RepID=UPI001F22CED7|nr:cystathionine beta-synthase [Tenacibaculum piscium]
MQQNQHTNIANYINEVLKNMPEDWLKLTTHRLDIYNEKLAKTQFLEQFQNLYINNNSDNKALYQLPTAYDYIRLGHPLSCILEWSIATEKQLKSENIISFSSKTMPVLAILRKNLLENKNTKIFYIEKLPSNFDAEILKNTYGYQFELQKISQKELADFSNIYKSETFEGSTILIAEKENICDFQLLPTIDFCVNTNNKLGSIIIINNKIENDKIDTKIKENNQAEINNYIAAIQHVRRRESIAMTPENSLIALQKFTAKENNQEIKKDVKKDIKEAKKIVLETISKITTSSTKPLVASSGLSMQYAIMMGLIDDAQQNHPSKKIKFIVPPNCYGGTNDQARRVADSIENVAVVDLLVDGDNEMVQSLDRILAEIAEQDAIPYIIAEIPTNPRVEVPNLQDLNKVLSTKRSTKTGEMAIAPVFILDQTFCPNVHFLGENDILSNVNVISYVSGSKFPSGGKCTAGYCVGNAKTHALIEKIDTHLTISDNQATDYQYEILAKQLPSMNQRIEDAYKNTREFVTFISEKLPTANINFVSEELASQSFMPSVFSLDLPTKGNTHQEKESYKRALNLKLINLMITKIPQESKFCVSYGQLNGCYWTIPATSTQGTTKEGDKDYIVRVSISPTMDVELHKKVFSEFVEML